ncbi:hypothetical protein PPO43_02540 [Saprospira sp. CCB-QB6]|uniref:DUF7847 domain-containing protein n=1 Tax=Saprospira sp. CCB-QB6 TaxID=3023936 RepID=UPI00234A202A|nr:hypothetical protein [Saprospira sp. CCB-QB6]WCL81978.1 hypothetical protein PPO43_02540 [Saprospira sp. CCB-QB6]
MNNFERRLEQAVQNNYRFSAGDVLNKGYELLRDYFFYFIGYTLLWGLAKFLLAIIGQLTFEILSDILNLFVNAFFVAGYYYMADKIYRKEEPKFSDFFLAGPKLLKLTLTYFLICILVVIPFLPMIIVLIIDQNSEFDSLSNMISSSIGQSSFGIISFSLLFLGGVGCFLTYAATSLALPIVTFSNLGPVEALKASLKLMKGNFLSWFFYAFISLLLLFFAAIALLVGLLVAIPVVMLAQYVILADALKFGQEEEIEDAGDLSDHFIIE